MNYEEMSDFEINKAVSSKFRKVWTWKGKVYLSMTSTKPFDPCNNPNDAWPIIEMIWERLMQVDAYYQAHTKWEAYCIEHKVGKLRAAMIAFLKMKDAEK